ncbi:class I SAM-dependent methyltransferase [Rhodanobacter sp. L36]|uniref:methyltransferase regulatory domain-containing protein n=1 Tax=Rhodanobacter sp. L36 TaxID=1747221 RepID=UPI00131E3A9C|nr:class I SAM-dependent methyltransferase [Rhodanobacter sp. L36]
MSELIERIAGTYDELPYNSSAFAQSAPEHLHAVAHLFGLKTPPPARARVLELGCAAGGNLIPFAAHHPQGHAVGVDLSGVQIDAGQRAVRAMGLKNIQLKQASIPDLGKDLGEFDYIICHGVYSWVPEDVREAILRVSRENLSVDGVVYISYNTYPGWKAKEVVRDAMLLRAGPLKTQSEKLRYARGMVDFLHDMARDGSVLKKIMQDNIEMIRHGNESYLAHEFLELCNAPCYFRDFLDAAGRHGLDFLAESEVPRMFAYNYGSQAAEPLLRECNGSQVVLEQLLDFLNNRTFRQTLLVHADRASSIRYQLDNSRFKDMHVAGFFTLVEGEQSTWRTSNDTHLFYGRPIPREVIPRLGAAWPATIAVSTLIADARAGDANHADAAEAELLQLIEQLIITGAVRVRLDEVKPANPTSGAPHLPEPLRHLAKAQQGEKLPISLYNAWHDTMPNPDVVETVLLPLLDGEHDHAALMAAMRESVKNGQLKFMQDGQPLTEEKDIERAAVEHIDAVLKRLAERGAFLTPG